MCIYLAEESGKIIRDVQKSGALNTHHKDNGEGPVTVADFKVQKNIQDNLNALYPSLRIQGEEADESINKY